MAAGALADLPLAGDYHGMGGPESVPLEAPHSAFVRPEAERPHAKCLLDDLFLAPSASQISAYNRVSHKRQT